jgi:hypothetical protein
MPMSSKRQTQTASWISFARRSFAARCVAGDASDPDSRRADWRT